MKIISFNRKEGVAKIRVNLLDDLWHLSRIIEPGDLVAGEIERKIKLSGEEERTRVAKKLYYAKIKVQKVQLESAFLKLYGEIVEGPEDVPIGSAHTLDIKVGFEIKLEKPWKDYQIKRLEAAEAASVAPKAIVCVLDDEQANLAAMTAVGINYLGTFQLGLAKKRFAEKGEDKFGKLVAEILRLMEQSKPDYLILGSPLFWKEELLKKLQEKSPGIAKKVKMEDVSTGYRRGVAELINRGVLDKIIKQSQMQKDFKLVENLLIDIAKKGPAVYGLEKVRAAVDASAVKTLLVTDALIEKYREKQKFAELETLIDATEKQGGEVHIISTDNEAGEKLDGLGGIAALLRFKLT